MDRGRAGRRSGQSEDAEEVAGDAAFGLGVAEVWFEEGAELVSLHGGEHQVDGLGRIAVGGLFLGLSGGLEVDVEGFHAVEERAPSVADLGVVEGEGEELEGEGAVAFVDQAGADRGCNGAPQFRARAPEAIELALHLPVPLLVVVAAGGRDDHLLRLVVPVEAALGDAGAGGDVVHLDAVDAALGKEVERALRKAGGHFRGGRGHEGVLASDGGDGKSGRDEGDLIGDY